MFHLSLHLLNIKLQQINKILYPFYSRKLIKKLITFSFLLSFFNVANADDNYEKALSSFQKKAYSESIIHLKNSLKINQSHIASRVLLAENHLALGDGAGAETQLITAQQDGADNTRLSPLFAQSYLLQQKYDRVLEILNPRDNNIQLKSDIFVFRGLAYLGQSNLASAQEEFNQALALLPNNEDALLGEAKLALKRKQYTNVLPLIEKVLTINPVHADALLMAAITYKNNQKIEKALTIINRLIDLTPENYNALLVRSVLLVDLNRYDDALNDLNRITDELPNEPLSNYIKAATLSTINSNDEANKIYTHLAAITKQLPKKVMNEQPIYHFVAGLASFQEKNYKQAEKSLLSYVQFEPQDIKAIKLLANTQIALKANNRAKKNLMNAHFINKKDYEINRLLGRVNMLTNDAVKAEYFFNLMKEQQPNTLTTKTELANFYLFTGQYDETIKLFSQNINDDKYLKSLPSNVLFILVRAYKETTQYTKALRIIDKVIELEPDNSYAYQEKGSLFGLTKNLPKAKENYLIAQELDETNFQAVIHLARIHLIENQHETAIQLLKDQLTDGDNSALFIELGNTYESINDEKNADLFYRKAYSFNPSSVLSLSKIVNRHLKYNEIFEASNIVEGYLRKYEDSPQVYELAAQIYFINNQHTKALYALEKAVKASPHKGNSLLSLANMQLRLNQRDLSIISLQRAISWEEDFIPAYLLLIAILIEDKNKAETLALIERLEKVTQDVSLNNRLKGDLYWALDKKSTAIRYFQKSIKSKPNQAAVLGLYRIYRKNKAYKKINTLLTKWLKDNPKDLIAVVSLAENYRQQGDLKRTLNYYESLLSEYPNRLVLLNNTAIIAAEMALYDKATSLIDKAYAINNTNVNVIDTKAWIEVQKGNFDTALPLLREANTLDYQNAEVEYHLAVTLNKLNRSAEALIYLQNAVNSKQNFYDKEAAIKLLKKWKK